MEYNITLGSMSYMLVLMAFGVVGSCYQAYKIRGTAKPFEHRLYCGAFAGGVTMLVVSRMDLLSNGPLIHFGVATVLGLVAEKWDSDKMLSYLKGVR